MEKLLRIIRIFAWVLLLAYIYFQFGRYTCLGFPLMPEMLGNILSPMSTQGTVRSLAAVVILSMKKSV